MKIRKAKISDLQAIQRLNKALFDFEAKFKHAYNTNWPYEEAGKKYFIKRLKSKKSLIFIAEENLQQIGYIISFIQIYSYREVNPICEIENMFVEEQYRHTGIGKELIAVVKKEARKRNVKRLRVGAIAQNKSAIDFYRAQGFGEVSLYLEEVL